MSVGILIITHGNIGEALLNSANHVIENNPLTVKTLSVGRESDPDERFKRASKLYEDVDQGDGVLILTDLIGSTPSNVAYRLREHPNVNIITGINLSMLVRIFNYPSLSLADLTKKACSGGIDGITITCDCEQR